MEFINWKLLGAWENWVRVPLLAFIGLAAVALISGKIHQPESEDNENGK